MRLTENAVAAETLIHAAWDAHQAAANRLDGVHVSDITLCARKSWLARNGRPARYDADTRLLFLTGAGHHAIVQAVAGAAGSFSAEVEIPVRYVAPGVVIHGTVDLLLTELDTPDEIVCEIKTTRSSAAKLIEHSPHYLEQIACYCVALGATRARLYVLHLMGDYRARRTPILNAWDVEFSPDELARWEHEMVRRYRLITGSEPPSPYEAYAWECGYCPHAIAHGGACPGGGLRVPFFINTQMPTGIALDPE